jgi:hypothetical protein
MAEIGNLALSINTHAVGIVEDQHCIIFNVDPLATLEYHEIILVLQVTYYLKHPLSEVHLYRLSFPLHRII